MNSNPVQNLTLEMLLCHVKGAGHGERAENLSSDVALQAAQDLALGEPFRGAPAGVHLSALIEAHPGHCDPPESAVRLAVAASVQPVAGGLARGSRQWCDTAQGCERRLGAEPLWIVTSDNQESAGDVGTNPRQVQEFGGALLK